MNYKDYIADIPDFPQEGILFRDITPLMADGEAFHQACDEMIAFARKVGAEVIVGPESRGFIFGCPVAYELGIGFIPVRKPGKLPRETVSVSYDFSMRHTVKNGTRKRINLGFIISHAYIFFKFPPVFFRFDIAKL